MAYKVPYKTAHQIIICKTYWNFTSGEKDIVPTAPSMPSVNVLVPWKQTVRIDTRPKVAIAQSRTVSILMPLCFLSRM